MKPLSSILAPILILILLPSFAFPAPLTSLSRGSTLYVEDADSTFLVSPNESFSCGFYSVGSNAYTFAVWFSKSTDRTLAWTAGRDRLVNGHGSRITFQKDGKLILTDVDKAVVWSTNTSSTQANQMKLLDTGNLVIVDSNGKILWQSFDSPSDTLLPTQPITKNIKLLSSMAKGSLSPGYFNFYFDSNNVLTLLYDGPEISSVYWPNPDNNAFDNGRTIYNNSRYGVLDENGHFFASDQLAFDASDLGPGIRRRLRLGYDGNVRLYSLNESTGDWSMSWIAFKDRCSVHGLCGRNGVCRYTPIPQCSCPPGYEMTDVSDWNRGCKPKIDISCDSPHEFRFLELPNTVFWGYNIHTPTTISFRNCRKLCRRDCRCIAFVYKSEFSLCFVKDVLFNGKTTPTAGHSIYIKVPRLVKFPKPSVSQVYPLVCNTTKNINVKVEYNISSTKLKWTYFYWFLAAFFVVEILFIAFGWWYIFKRGMMPASLVEGYRILSSQFRKFTYKDLERATAKFKVELGRGGSGSVYKGVLDDGRAVAVKKLEDAILGEEEFWAEVSVIGRINHMNLVRMWGFCSERAHKLLVSEYVENGSLDKVLFDDESGATSLAWKERWKIALGVAKGLGYLHHECLEWVIHCDVKPENILLTRDFEPRIADFGLAKLFKRDGVGSNLSQIRGTRGYMAPEWASNLPITGKVDVYSYGVVLLELVKGSRISTWVMDWVDEDEGEMVLRRLSVVLKEKLGEGEDQWIGNFVDCRLNGEFNCKQAILMVEIAVSCLEEERSRRPSMDHIVEMLLYCHDQGDSEILTSLCENEANDDRVTLLLKQSRNSLSAITSTQGSQPPVY